MDRRARILLLPVLLSLLAVNEICGSCDSMEPCPPPFPDFMAFFAETLKNIPELLVTNRSSLSTDCPENVNWTEFNRRLDTDSPAPLDPVCSISTTPYLPPVANQSNPSNTLPSSLGVPITTKASGSPAVLPVTQGSTQSAPIQSDVKDPGGAPDIGLPVGIAVGAAVLLLIVVVTIAVCVRRHRTAKQPKENIYGREQSTTSHDALVTSFDVPDTPSVMQTVVILSDSTFQESSTDPTLRRPTASDLDGVVMEKKFPDEMEADGKRGGYDNVVFEVSLPEEDLEDPGYAGSEACQENWENEWNNKFEEALMESNEDLPEDVEDANCKGEPSFDSFHKEKLASRLSGNASKNLSPPTTKRVSSALNSPSSRKSQVLDFRLPSQTRSAAFSNGSSSPTKPPMTSSPFRRPSPTNWPTTAGVDPVTASSSKSPSTISTSEAPPAYSSPAVKQNGPPTFRHEKPSMSLEPPPTPSSETPPTPSGLPTYTEVMAARDTASASHPEPPPTSPQKQQRSPPSKPPKSTVGPRAPTAMSPSNTLKSQLVEEKSNPWKIQAKGSGKTIGVPEKPANTAVVRPWTAGNGQASEGKQSAMPSTSDETAGPDAAPTTPSDSVGEYSFRPVRSLLSQFETLDRKNP